MLSYDEMTHGVERKHYHDQLQHRMVVYNVNVMLFEIYNDSHNTTYTMNLFYTIQFTNIIQKFDVIHDAK